MKFEPLTGNGWGFFLAQNFWAFETCIQHGLHMAQRWLRNTPQFHTV
jgi:hypothetical protein